jgi:uncharacterized protein YndB with AHSA1/START domain
MSDAVIRKTVTIDAPPSVLFKALTDEKELVRHPIGRPSEADSGIGPRWRARPLHRSRS